MLPQIKLEQVWEDLTFALEEGRITQEEFDDLAFRLGDPDEIEFVDPTTSETETFTMEYAQSINSRIEEDVEYKQEMVDAWTAAALDHYDELSAELSSIS